MYKRRMYLPGLLPVLAFLALTSQGIPDALAAPTRVAVASKSVSGKSALSVSITHPINGNTLIAVISARSSTVGMVSSLTQTGATWAKAAGATNPNGSTTEIWYAPNVSSAGTAVNIGLASATDAAAIVVEYSGLISPSVLDVTAQASGDGPFISTGATAITAVMDELWIGGIGLAGDCSISCPTTNLFTIVMDETAKNDAHPNTKAFFLEKTVTDIGSAETGGATCSPSPWSGVIATFKASQTPKVTAWPTASPITYGQPLSSSTLNGGSASVPGTFSFDTPAATPATGTSSMTVVFTPADPASYAKVYGSVNISVSKAVPTVSAWPTATPILYGQTLADSTLSGGSALPAEGTFTWTNSSIAPRPGITSCSVTFLPTDTANFTSTTGTVTVTANQAPTITSANWAIFSVKGQSGKFAVTTVGYPAPAITLSNGTLPAGITLVDGLLNGSPTMDTIGTYLLQFKAANGIVSDYTQDFTLDVVEAPVRANSVLYPSINDAFAATSGLVEAMATPYTGTTTLGRNIDVTLEGGLDKDFNNTIGYSTVKGKLIISRGSLTLGRVQIM